MRGLEPLMNPLLTDLADEARRLIGNMVDTADPRVVQFFEQKLA